VSWNDAVAFCRWMTAKTGKRCRLPTEAEWEYACRAGTTTPFNTGENLTIAQANFDGAYPYKGNRKGISRKNTVPVESFAPNGWGLYTMHGNVWEWCSDLYDESYYERCKAVGTVVNPLGPSGDSTANHVLRGGGWNYSAQFCRSASRHNDIAANRYNYVGFRVVLVP